MAVSSISPSRCWRPLCSALLCLFLCSAPALYAATAEVVGLFRGRAVVRVPGAGEVLLKVGEEKHGVTLLAADADSATIRYQGETLRLSLSGRIAGSFTPAQRQQVTINADELGQYYVRGAINGQFVNFLVDTGASIVAISSVMADGLGLDYRRGQRGRVQTAQGLTDAFFLDLDQVTVSSLQARRVKAAVILGAYPVDILLGMSFLRSVRMEEDGGVLTLSQQR
ncbi:MAG: retropepsin-like aspartic protease [Pseudomonadota bacterium]